MEKNIIAIATAKGGVGKSTVAMNLAYLRASEKGNQNVILIDADSKTGTATIWADLRTRDENLLPLLVMKKTGSKDFVQAIKLLPHSDIIIDVGGDNELELMASMAVAHKLFVPVRPSFIDTFSFFALDNQIGRAMATVNPGLQVYLLPSVVSPNKLMVGDDLADIQELATDLENMPLAKNFIYDRKAYRRSPKFNGKTIFELNNEEKRDEAAIEEMLKFYGEVYGK